MDILYATEACVLPRPRGAELLVVDQNRTNLDVLGRRLTQLGYGVSLAEKGSEALDIISARRFDLVLLDLGRSDMDSGMMVLRELRGTPQTADLPVILISAHDDADAAVEALDAGADDHVVKPFDFAELAARIDRQIRRHRSFETLRRSYADLDGRIACRAAELGELRAAMALAQADRSQLMSTITQLNDRLERMAING